MTQRPSSASELALWTPVDRYFEQAFGPDDPVLEAALRASAAAGLPEIQVSPLQGRFLHLLARGIRAERILEVGTLGGYSTIWLGRALPNTGRLLTLEREPKHAEVARANLARAGLTDRVEVRIGPAAATLAELAQGRTPPFDLIFLDADKDGLAGYLRSAVRLARPGGLIVADNVVRRGDVADPADPDPGVRGVRAMIDAVAREPRLFASTLQTVGVKGHDGMMLAVVLPEP